MGDRVGLADRMSCVSGARGHYLTAASGWH
jgi:hypothetical protein